MKRRKAEEVGKGGRSKGWMSRREGGRMKREGKKREEGEGRRWWKRREKRGEGGRREGERGVWERCRRLGRGG